MSSSEITGALAVIVMFGAPLLAGIALVAVIVAVEIKHLPDKKRLRKIRRMKDNAAALRELERFDRDMRKKHGREWGES